MPRNDNGSKSDDIHFVCINYSPASYLAGITTTITEYLMTKHLTGDKCQCPSCGIYFNSERAFDKHRVGIFGSTNPIHKRRCLSEQEMLDRGMCMNEAGWWITKVYEGPRRKAPQEPNGGVSGLDIPYPLPDPDTPI